MPEQSTNEQSTKEGKTPGNGRPRFVVGESLTELSPACQQLLDYFKAKTGGKRPPRRSDLNPTELVKLLPRLCILEPLLADDGQLRDVIMRLQGTAIASAFGEITGQSIGRLPDPEARARALAVTKMVLQERAPVGAFAEQLSSEKQYLQVEVLAIPLFAEDGEIHQILSHITVTVRDDCKPEP